MRKVKLLLTAVLILTLSISALAVVSSAAKFDAPTNASIVSGKLIDIDPAKTYEVAKITLPVTELETQATIGEYADYVAGETDLTAGLWSVRVKADDTNEASDAVTLWSIGVNAGSVAFAIHNDIWDNSPNPCIDSGAGQWYVVHDTAVIGALDSETHTASYAIQTSTTPANNWINMTIDGVEREEWLVSKLIYPMTEEEYYPVKDFKGWGTSMLYLSFPGTDVASAPETLEGKVVIHVYDNGTISQYETTTGAWSVAKQTLLKCNFANVDLPDTGYIFRIDIDWVDESKYTLNDITTIDGSYSAARTQWLGVTSDKTRINYSTYHSQAKRLAPVTTLAYDLSDNGYIITGLDQTLTYRYSTDGGVTFYDVPTASTSMEVTELGTYSFYSVEDDKYFASEMATIDVVEIVRPEAPELSIVAGNQIAGLIDGVSYEYAQLNAPLTQVASPLITGEFAPLTAETELTGGLWAVRTVATETDAASKNAILYVVGENAGSITWDIFQTNWTTTPTYPRLAKWTFINTIDVDGEYYLEEDFTDYSIEVNFYTSGSGILFSAVNAEKAVYATGMFTYVFDNDEIVPARDFDGWPDLTGKVARLQTIHSEFFASPETITGKIVAHVYGGQQKTYEKKFTYPASGANTIIDLGFDDIIPDTETGYVWRIDVDVVDEDTTPYSTLTFNKEEAPYHFSQTRLMFNGYTDSTNMRIKYTLNKAQAPETVLGFQGSMTGDGFEITGLDPTLTYKVSTDAITYTDVPAESSVISVDNPGTYYVYSVEDANYYQSKLASVVVTPLAEAPTGLSTKQGRIQGLVDGIAYEYAQLNSPLTKIAGVFTPGEFAPVTQDTTLTGGLWAIRVAATETQPASKMAIVYVVGEDVGSVAFQNKQTLYTANPVPSQGMWTPINSIVPDGEYYLAEDFTNFSVQTGLDQPGSYFTFTVVPEQYQEFTTGTITYIMTNEEIVPARDFDAWPAITGKVARHSTLGNKILTGPETITGKIVLHVYGGLATTYEKTFTYPSSGANTIVDFGFGNIIPDNETGYVWRIDIDVVDEDTTPYSSLSYVTTSYAQDKWGFVGYLDSSDPDDVRITYIGKRAAPINLTTQASNNEGKYFITGFDIGLAHYISTDLENYTQIPKGTTHYEVDAGTYYVYAEGSDSYYESKIQTVVVDAESLAVTSLEITTPPTITLYAEGDTLSAEGIVVLATHANGTAIEIGADDVTVTPEVLDTAGTVTITVTFAGASATYDVTVKGLNETVTGLEYADGAITGLDAAKSYEWTKVTALGEGEWTAVEAGATTLAATEPGIWAVRHPETDALVPGDAQYIFVKGDRAGTLSMDYAATADERVLGKWAGNSTYMTVNYTANNGVKGYCISLGTVVYANGMLDGAEFEYLFAEDEIIEAKNVGGFQTLVVNGTITKDASVEYCVRFNIVGGKNDYYDIKGYYKLEDVMVFDLASVIPEDENGYLVSIEFIPYTGVPEGATPGVTSGSTSAWVGTFLRFPDTYIVDGFGNTDDDRKLEGRLRVNINRETAPSELSTETDTSLYYATTKIVGFDSTKSYQYKYNNKASSWTSLPSSTKELIIPQGSSISVRYKHTATTKAPAFVTFEADALPRPVFGKTTWSGYPSVVGHGAMDGYWCFNSTNNYKWECKSDYPTYTITQSLDLSDVSIAYYFTDDQKFVVDDNPYFMIDWNATFSNVNIEEDFKNWDMKVDIYLEGLESPVSVIGDWKGYQVTGTGFTANLICENLLDTHPETSGKTVTAVVINPIYNMEGKTLLDSYESDSTEARTVNFSLRALGFIDARINIDSINSNRRVANFVGVKAYAPRVFEIGDTLTIEDLDVFEIYEFVAGGRVLSQIEKAELTISDDFATASGTYQATVSHRGYTIDVPVHVGLVDIAVKNAPNKVEYVVGQSVKIEGLVLEGLLASGDVVTLSGKVDYTPVVSEGMSEVIVTYQGFETSYPITIVSRALASIAINTYPIYHSDNFIQGDDQNFEGLSIKAFYNDDTWEIVRYGEEGLELSYNNEYMTPGGRLTINYGGKQLVTTLNMKLRTLVSISQATPANKTTFVLGEAFSAEGLTVRKFYNNGTEEILPYTSFTMTTPDMTLPGTQDVTLTFDEFSMTYQITVVEETNNIAEGTIGEDITWSIDEAGVLIVSGQGELPDYMRNTNNAPWYDYSKEITAIAIEDGITRLGDYAFYKLSNAQSITVAESVKEVGIQFIRQTAITEIELPGVEIIAGNAFGRADSLTRLVLPECVHDIQGNMFYAETVTVVAPEGSYVDYYLDLYTEIFGTGATVTFEANGVAERTILEFRKVGQSAFYALYEERTNVWTLEYSGSGKMTNFAYYSDKNVARGLAFSPARVLHNDDGKCVYITKAILGDALTNLGNYALEMCTKVKAVELGENMTRIGRDAFRSVAIKSLVIPEGVVLIDNQAFVNCNALTSLTIPSTITSDDPNAMAYDKMGLGRDLFLKCDPATKEDNAIKLVVTTENEIVKNYISENYPVLSENSGITEEKTTLFDGKEIVFDVVGNFEEIASTGRILLGAMATSNGTITYNDAQKLEKFAGISSSYEYVKLQLENVSKSDAKLSIAGVDMAKATLQYLSGVEAIFELENGEMLIPAGFDGYVIFSTEDITLDSLEISVTNKEDGAYLALDRMFVSNTLTEELEETLNDEIQQKVEILDATMEKLLFTAPKYKIIPEFKPTAKGYEHIEAITYDGLEINGKKTKTFAYIGFPKNMDPDTPVPAVVLVHGGGGHAFLRWVEKWNNQGYAAIAMDLVGNFPLQVNADITEGTTTNTGYGLSGVFLENGYTNSPKSDGLYSSAKPIEEQWMYHSVSKVILAHNILLTDSRIDSDRIGITGISWGGITTSIAIGHDPRFAFAIPVYGAGYQIEENENMSFRQKFDDEATYRIWAAERLFENAKMPILWMAYNDDNNWTVIPHTYSYADTVRNNSRTMLAYIHKMGHSHGAGWGPSMIYKFANSIVGDGHEMVTFVNQPSGREVYCELNNPDSLTLFPTAKIYYITEELTVSTNNSSGLTLMDQEWQIKEFPIGEDGIVEATVPEDAWGYYVEVKFIEENRECTVTSEWMVLGE